MIGRDTPKCLPDLIAFTNSSAFNLPIPVSASDVRLTASEIPHGSAKAVLVADPAQTHAPSGFGGGGITLPAGTQQAFA